MDGVSGINTAISGRAAGEPSAPARPGELDLTEVHEIIRNTRTSSSGPNGPGTLCDWLEALQVCGVGFLEASDARQGQASGTSHRSAMAQNVAEGRCAIPRSRRRRQRAAADFRWPS